MSTDQLDDQDIRKLTIHINDISHTIQKQEVDKLVDSIQGIKDKYISQPNASMGKYKIKIIFKDSLSLVKFMNSKETKQMEKKLQFWINFNLELYDSLIIKKINLSAENDQIKEIIMEYLTEQTKIEPLCMIRVIQQKYDKFAIITFIIKEQYQQAHKVLVDQKFTETMSKKVFGEAKVIVNMQEVERRRDAHEIMLKDNEIIYMPVQRYDKEKRQQTIKRYDSQYNKYSQGGGYQSQKPNYPMNQYYDRYQPNMNTYDMRYQHQPIDKYDDYNSQYPKSPFRSDQQQYGQPVFYRKYDRMGSTDLRDPPMYNNYDRYYGYPDRYGDQYQSDYNNQLFLKYIPVQVTELQIQGVIQRYANVKKITIYPYKREHTYKNALITFSNYDAQQFIMKHQDDVRALGEDISLSVFIPKQRQ